MEAIAATHAGLCRHINEDSIYCNNAPIGIMPNLFIVADGIGGHNAGELASGFSINCFIDYVKNRSGKTIISTFESAIMHTNEALISESKKSKTLEGMGTTFVATTVCGDSAYIMNIGDSRLYFFDRKKGIKQITQDHSYIAEMVKHGELDKNDIKENPNKNYITMALGSNDNFKPDYFEINVSKGNYILLCSDGLYDMLEDKTIEDILSEDMIEFEKKADKLIEMANEQGGEDNISVVLIRV